MNINFRSVIFLAVAVSPFCASAARNPNKFIDLTHSFNNNTMSWPGRKSSFYIESEGDSAGFFVASRGFCTSEHTSTHIDAPYHFNKYGRKLHEIPLEDLIDVPGVMIDIYDKVHKFKDGKLNVIENYALTQDDVIEWEEKNGKIPQGAVVLLRTGWESRWGDLKMYRGEKDSATAEASKNESDKNDNTIPLDVNLNFPAFDASAARYLAVERQVLGVGVDALSIDPGNTKTFPAHRLFAARNIYMLEMVSNLHVLPPRGFNLWMVPFKIDFGTGAPTRVLARLNSFGNQRGDKDKNVDAEGYSPDGYFWASKSFCTSEHTSTHIDAPYHANEEGRKLHEIPLEDLIDIPGVMIDVYDKIHKFKDGKLDVIENYVLTQEDVLEWEEKNGKIPQGTVVLLRTGWETRWGDLKLYRGEKDLAQDGDKPAFNLNFPAFDGSAARFLAAERQVLGVGVDTLSIDPGNTKTYPAHRLFAARNIYMLEMVANLHVLPPRGFNLWMVPFKIDAGTGAPTRVLARLNKFGQQ